MHGDTIHSTRQFVRLTILQSMLNADCFTWTEIDVHVLGFFSSWTHASRIVYRRVEYSLSIYLILLCRNTRTQTGRDRARAYICYMHIWLDIRFKVHFLIQNNKLCAHSIVNRRTDSERSSTQTMLTKQTKLKNTFELTICGCVCIRKYGS